MTKRMCSVVGCGRVGQLRGGLCNTHYKRWRQYGSLDLPPRVRLDRRCSVEGCDEPYSARGWCQSHYGHWRAHGDPLVSSYIRGDDSRRLWSQIERRGPDECWPWTGRLARNGYGHIWSGGKPMQLVHRLVYEAEVGPIPEGLTLDHLCHTNDLGCPGGPDCVHRRCCNPAHLEPVTAEENTRRGRSWQRRKTHCPQGHPYDEENTYYAPSTPTHRQCRACNRERNGTPEAMARQREYRRRRKATWVHPGSEPHHPAP